MRKNGVRSRKILIRIFMCVALSGCPLLDSKAPQDVDGLSVARVYDRSIDLSWESVLVDYSLKGIKVNYSSVSDPSCELLVVPLVLSPDSTGCTVTFPYNERDYIITISTFDYSKLDSAGISILVHPKARPRKISHYDDGLFSYYEIYSYENSGLISKKVRYHGDGESYELLWFEYYENDGTKITGIDRYMANTEPATLIYHGEYAFDDVGFPATYTWSTAADELVTVTTFECDDNGHVIQETVTDNSGTTTSVTSLTYDGDGVFTGKVTTKTTVVETYTVERDALGNTTYLRCVVTGSDASTSYDHYEDYVAK